MNVPQGQHISRKREKIKPVPQVRNINFYKVEMNFEKPECQNKKHIYKWVENNKEQHLMIVKNYYQKNKEKIIINYESFKILNTIIDKKVILNHLLYTIETVLNQFELFTVHANIKKLTLLEIDKNKDFIQKASIVLKEKYPYKLDTCYIYDAPSMFNNIFKLIFAFVDKETQKKIKIVESSP